MKLVPIIGDGNCLFHACAYYLKTDASKIRGYIAATIKKYPNLPIEGTSIREWIEMVSGMSVKKYIHYISHDKTWGSGFEVSLIAIIFRRTIQIYHLQDGKIVLMTQFFPQFEKPIKLLWNHNHYDVVVN